MPRNTKPPAAPARKRGAVKSPTNAVQGEHVAERNDSLSPAIVEKARQLDDDLTWHLVSQLVSRRIELEISQADMARQIRTTQPTLSLIEAGKQSPSVAVMQRYVRALGGRLVLLVERW